MRYVDDDSTTGRNLLDLPLRGREHEMKSIRSTLAAGVADGFSALTIESVPGIGKTRLLREAVSMAQGLGFSTVTRNADQQFRLAAARTTSSGRGDADAMPVLFAIDDAHLLGEEEIGALTAHRGETRDRAATWLITRRPGGDNAVDSVLPRPNSMRERIVLDTLSPCAIREVTVDMLGMPPAPALAELIDSVDGNPMLVIELLEGMRREGTLISAPPEADIVEDRIPESLHLLVRSMLKDYSVQCRKLLRVAGALGRRLDFDQLAALLNVSLPALLPLLEEAGDSGVVSCDDDMGMSFRSELLWRVVADSVPHAVRRELARQANAIEPTSPGERPRLTRSIAAGTESPHSESEIDVHNSLMNEQERTIIRLVGAGLTNRQIARQISLSPHTVNYHLKKIFRSFGVSSRIGLLEAVRQQELIT
ncbi:MAG: LuxR C-terminal-related transcriptional regulator [Actinomycetota bacterium]|nr:LuxR C-terminal-related transcriptional regulator [Actinomycetota bacterium]